MAIGSAGFGGDTFLGGAVVEFGSGFKLQLNVSANSSSVPVQFIVLSGGTLSGGEVARGNAVTVAPAASRAGSPSTAAPASSSRPAGLISTRPYRAAAS